jgi:hypothetical protein
MHSSGTEQGPVASSCGHGNEPSSSIKAEANKIFSKKNSAPWRLQLSVVAERRGRVVSPPPSYCGGPGFKSRPGDWLS